MRRYILSTALLFLFLSVASSQPESATPEADKVVREVIELLTKRRNDLILNKGKQADIARIDVAIERLQLLSTLTTEQFRTRVVGKTESEIVQDLGAPHRKLASGKTMTYVYNIRTLDEEKKMFNESVNLIFVGGKSIGPVFNKKAAK